MALLVQFSPVKKERNSVHEPTHCSYCMFTGPDGTKYLQLDTHGRRTRKYPGKVSQSIQLDARAARDLRRVIDEVF